MLKEKGVNSLPEAYFCSPLKVDVTCVKILHGRKMRDPPQSIHTKIISLQIKKINLCYISKLLMNEYSNSFKGEIKMCKSLPSNQNSLEYTYQQNY